MNPRNIIAFVLVLISFGLLYPGLTWPLITISASVEFAGNTFEIFKQTRSTIGTIRDLHDSGNDFVAGLILLFSVVVPFAKGALLGVVMIMRRGQARLRIHRFVRSIGKWAMADVFVVGVFVAFLAAKATDNLDAEVQSGFYYFTAYCLVSLIALQFMVVKE